MAIRNVVTRGFGAGALIRFIITRGYAGLSIKVKKVLFTSASAGADFSSSQQRIEFSSASQSASITDGN